MAWDPRSLLYVTEFLPGVRIRTQSKGSTFLIFPGEWKWIMGLGSFMSSWQRQSKDFGHSQNTNTYQSPKYESLVFDNRGMGKSDKPFFRYSTFEMAKDVVELVDSLGWTESRQLHVIGISMGGMIAQELVSRMFSLVD